MFFSINKWVATSLKNVKPSNKSKRPKKGGSKPLFSNGVDWITSSFATMEVSNQLQQVFKLIDVNGDGKISPLELGDVLLCLGHEKSTAGKEAEVMIREADYNGDGFIDIDEFMEVVNVTAKESALNDHDEIMDAFVIFDTDKNGFISANELRQVLISLGCDKCTLQECSLMITGADKDGDGLVDFEEFKSMMKS